ncbi:MAG: ClpXP protease specificity-enhancing factor SspB, partial [Geminicoccaceae bacterium]
EYLRDRYPTDMTNVLQHQFWDLAIDDEGFAVTLSFSDQLQRLRIPFAAIKVFADPGVEFGLQFTIDEDGETESADVRLLGASVKGGKEEPGEAGAESGGAEIVTLDRFRKK